MSPLIGKTRLKPPSFLVFCGDKAGLFNEIRATLRQILPIDTYTIAELTKRALIEQPWMQYCACLFIADAVNLDKQSQARFNAYLLRNPSKIMVVAEDLSEALMRRQQIELFENVFGSESQIAHFFGEPGICYSLGEKLKFLGGEDETSISFPSSTLSECLEDFDANFLEESDGTFCLQLAHKSHERKLLLFDAPISRLLDTNSTANGLSLIHKLLDRMDIEAVCANGKIQSQQPQLTAGFLFTNPDRAVLNITGMAYDKELGSHPKLLFCPSANIADSKQFSSAHPTATLIPVEVRRQRDLLPDGTSKKFDVQKYYARLSTKHFGQALLFVPVTTSTMDVSESIANAFPSVDGTLVVAGHQTAGRGSIGNEWLCSEGAAMFNVNLNVPYQSQLGQHICLLQHLFAVSICEAIAELAPEFPAKIKWPNDLYFSRLSKIGGVLVRTSQNEAEQKYSCLIGVGLNIANSKPTVCINDMLPPGATKLNIEETLALILNKFEGNLSIFQANGKAQLVRDYYKFWLHTDEEVSILRVEDGSHERVIVRGLDDDGYLLVRSKQTGQLISLMSDGNSFDLFSGLIVPKLM